VRFLSAASKAFLGAFVAVLTAMLVSDWLGLAPFQVWVAIGMAVGIALAFGAKERWQLSQGVSSLLVGLSVGVGSIVGHLLSAHA
jgi:hypothetical protein